MIKKIREDHGLTQTELAKKLGVHKITISSWEREKRHPSATQRKKLCEVFNINEAELFMNEENATAWLQKLHENATLQSSSQPPSPSPNIVSVAEPIHEVPLISWVVANQFGEAVDIFQPGQADEWVTTTHKGKDCFALRVKGDCMTPVFLENDRIIIDPNMNPEHNDYIIARDSASNEATFKQYKKYGEKIVLHPLNTNYDDILVDSSRYEIVGVVVDLNRKIK